MIDIVREIDAVQREVRTGRTAAGEGRQVRLQRTYDAPIDDVWDAFTNPERIGRWFLPISGDYRLGGSYQFEGNAGGEIVECARPNRLKVTWAYGVVSSPADVSEVEILLAPAGDQKTTRRARAHRHRPRGDVGRVRSRAPSAWAGTGACSAWRSISRADRWVIPWRGRCPTKDATSTGDAARPGAKRTEPWRRPRSGCAGRGEHQHVLRTGAGSSERLRHVAPIATEPFRIGGILGRR